MPLRLDRIERTAVDVGACDIDQACTRELPIRPMHAPETLPAPGSAVGRYDGRFGRAVGTGIDVCEDVAGFDPKPYRQKPLRHSAEILAHESRRLTEHTPGDDVAVAAMAAGRI